MITRFQGPEVVSPMLAKLVRKLPEGKGWAYEAKWDGYRILALKKGPEVRLLSRRGTDFTSRFKRVAGLVGELRCEVALLDGEVVAIDEQGRPSFQVLQNRGSLAAGYQLAYYAFDLLHVDGEDLRTRPLSERKERLSELVAGEQSPVVGVPARKGKGDHESGPRTRVGGRRGQAAGFCLRSRRAEWFLGEAAAETEG